MERVEAGMLAVSRAGHDKGSLYAVKAVEGEYCLLVDGDLKPMEKPKKKSLKHIQIIRNISPELLNIDTGNTKNEVVKRVIKQYRQSIDQTGCK